MTLAFLERALWIAALLSGLPLVASFIAAALVSLIQQVFQVQEQTLVHLVRFATGSIVLGCIGPWGLAEVVSLLSDAFLLVSAVGGSR